MGKAFLMATGAGAAMLLCAGAADAATPFDWSGLYIGAHGGYLNGDAHLSEDAAPGGGNISGTIGGLLGGYNFPNAPVPYVLGVEGDFGWGNVQGNGTVIICESDCTPTFHYDLEWDAHLRARAAMPMGNFMPFVAGGLAFANLNITEGSPLWDNTYVGGTIGAGVDVKLGPSFIGRAEVLYDFYPTVSREDYKVSLSAVTARVAVIFRLP